MNDHFMNHVFEPFWPARQRGNQHYRLRVPADTPTHDFWSIIAYEVGTNGFIHNPENRVGVSSYDKQQMAVNADGSVDVYVEPTAPAA